MSREADRRDAGKDEEDEKIRRALEIHQRLMREHNLQFYNRADPESEAPPSPPTRDGEDERERR